jgi:hypothetical protein
MMDTCRTYLTQQLKSCGINKVFTKAEDAAQYKAVPYAKVAFDDEDLKYDGSLVARADGPNQGERTLRRRTYMRTIQARVKIVHRDQAAAEAAGTNFLSGLARRIMDPDNNAILINARSGEPEPDEDTSLLRQQGTSYYLVTFDGGIYRDKIVQVYELETALAVESEIVEEV